MENERSNSGFLVFLKRILLISVVVIVSVLICYSCSAINKVSGYTINLNDSIGNIYESENQDTVLIINTKEEAYFNTKEEGLTSLYSIEQKDNLLLLTANKGEETTKLVFVSLSKNEIFWQTKNSILYRWEDE